MRTQQIAQLLEDRGYTVEIRPVIKNGVERMGLIVRTENLSPTFYIEQMEDLGDLEIVENIVNVVEYGIKPDLDVERIAERDFIMENVIPAIQHAGSEPIVKYQMMDLEVYFRVIMPQIEGIASYKLTADMLERAGIDKEELFNQALRNIEPHIHVCTMAQMLSEKMGIDIADMGGVEVPLYVGYSDYQSFGASAMLNNRIMEEIADKVGSRKLAILPSSIEEILILKMDEDDETPEKVAELNSMITSVNEDVVGDDLYLSGHLYIWDNGELRLANC